ncbi:hypothetical protein CUC08_Gglean004645 [Alternaria sp. MG1]|nr:hypothetical protein CUC08_Gglean004645 [Alternaria sp. MG1]
MEILFNEIWRGNYRCCVKTEQLPYLGRFLVFRFGRSNMKSVKHFEESIQSHFVVRARCMAIPRIHACKGYTEWVLETPIQSDYGSFRSQPSPHCMSITRL